MNEIVNYSCEISSGWTWAKIGDMISSEGEFIDGDWVESKDQDENGDVRLIQLADIGDGYYRNKSHRFLTYQKAIQLKCTFLEVGDVLLARMPDPLGRCCLFPGDKKKAVTVVDVCIIRPGINSVNKYWLMYFINASEFRAQIAALQSGSTRKRISRGNLSTLSLPLPPLPEQHRIVAKLEELFTKLDVAIDELKKAKAQIKRYRQSVLKHAFEGRLTEQWRIENLDLRGETAEELLAKIKEERKKELGKKYKAGTERSRSELPPVDTTNLPQLPDGWVWTTLEQVTSVLGDGLHGTPKYSVDGEYYFINGNNLSDGKIEIKSDTKRVPLEEYYKYKKPLSARTILVSINGTLGKTAFYEEENIILGKSACYFNIFDQIDKYYVRYILVSQRFIDYSNKTATGSTIKNVPLSAMRAFEIPIASTIQEQQQIVSEIERHFSVADETEKIIDQSLKQAERLRQSILKDAFSGKLVPQDPNDPPASLLLEKIKEEKAKHTGNIKPKKRDKRTGGEVVGEDKGGKSKDRCK